MFNDRAVMVRRARTLQSQLSFHASVFVRSLTDPSPVIAGVRDWGPVFLPDDLKELVGYLRELGRGLLAERLQDAERDAEDLWLQAKGLRTRSVPEPVDLLGLVRTATGLLILVLDAAGKELELEWQSVDPTLTWLSGFGKSAASIPLPKAVALGDMAVPATGAEATPRAGSTERTALNGFAPADTLSHDHGIRPARLSEAANAGSVSTMKAPPGQLDSQGKKVRVLYNVQEAIRHCSPKRVQRKATGLFGKR